MTVVPISGRKAIALALKARTMHMAIGTGDGSWTTPPPIPGSVSALQNEVGRRLVSEVSYVMPDATGDLAFSGILYSRTATPTNQLIAVANFTDGEASGEVIREIGIFIDTERVSGVPIGQQWLIPAEVESPGVLYAINYQAPDLKPAATWWTRTFLLTL
jgi:hypothetical protein